ncbi:hypothetical protein DXG03_007759 [Asterophora parasitica]|uniref:Sulfhydryl oxidase n=1 Tax=Asterophora parasitica TaxID=117018 RepID=A0A9P7KGI7_9AGAR|nr:hypothetical protein DXG03_007759 [Asterophora parasitica]
MSTTNAPPSASSTSTTKMPPGMVMGPDGKPCKICTAFRNWKPGPNSGIEGNDRGKHTGAGVAGRNRSTAAVFAALASGTAVGAKPIANSAPSQISRVEGPPPNCPPDVEQLGRATWTFLHTTAAYYPEKPSPTQRANMLMLLRSLPLLYPCTNCANDFGEDIKVHPPDVSGRVGLSRWLCERHNEVNEKLGKEKFDCAIEKTDERWKDGPTDGSCD